MRRRCHSPVRSRRTLIASKNDATLQNHPIRSRRRQQTGVQTPRPCPSPRKSYRIIRAGIRQSPQLTWNSQTYWAGIQEHTKGRGGLAHKDSSRQTLTRGAGSVGDLVVGNPLCRKPRMQETRSEGDLKLVGPHLRVRRRLKNHTARLDSDRTAHVCDVAWQAELKILFWYCGANQNWFGRHGTVRLHSLTGGSEVEVEEYWVEAVVC